MATSPSGAGQRSSLATLAPIDGDIAFGAVQQRLIGDLRPAAAEQSRRRRRNDSGAQRWWVALRLSRASQALVPAATPWSTLPETGQMGGMAGEVGRPAVAPLVICSPRAGMPCPLAQGAGGAGPGGATRSGHWRRRHQPAASASTPGDGTASPCSPGYTPTRPWRRERWLIAEAANRG
jgi:hypothetical protein